MLIKLLISVLFIWLNILVYILQMITKCWIFLENCSDNSADVKKKCIQKRK